MTKDASLARLGWSMPGLVHALMAVWVSTACEAQGMPAGHPGHGISPSLLLSLHRRGEDWA